MTVAKKSPIAGAVKVNEYLPRDLTEDEFKQFALTCANLRGEIKMLQEQLADHKTNVKAMISSKDQKISDLSKMIQNKQIWEQMVAYRKIVGRVIHYFDEEGTEIYSKDASDADLQINMFATEMKAREVEADL